MSEYCYEVTIENLDTGEVGDPELMTFSDDDLVRFMFDSGNYACDCNRGLFFDGGDYRCGETNFGVTVRDCLGRVIYQDPLDVFAAEQWWITGPAS